MSSFETLVQAYDAGLEKRGGRLVPVREDHALQIVKLAGQHLEFNGFLDCGGEAILFKVLDKNLNDLQRVLKIPRAHLKDRDRQRFIRSARLLARQNSMYFPTVIHLSLEPLFLLLDWTPGVTLREWIKSSKYSMGMAIEYYRAILIAISFFHRESVAHRDIKPDNILITYEDMVKILDFGLAKSKEDKTYTRVGDELGVEEYVAPEQEINPAAATDTTVDVFSLGHIFYEMFTRDSTFENATDLMKALGHSDEVINFYQIACDIDSHQRFKNAQEMLIAFNELYPALSIEPSRKEDIYTVLEDLLVLCAGDRFKVGLITGMTKNELFPLWAALKERKAKQCLSSLTEV